jgi:hypothetical protein
MMMVRRSEIAMNSSTVFVGDWMLGLKQKDVVIVKLGVY